jgi:predicted  nucleic acid-binding Zn-ribbon protein
MPFEEQVLKELVDIKAELSKIREPKKAAKTDYLTKLVKLLTDEQLEFYYRMYPSGEPAYVDIAINQVETTLKKLNQDTAKLRSDFKETLKVQEEVQVELKASKLLIKGLEDDLREANKQIERLSNSETLDSAEIQERLAWLSALECAGVDNWDGYGYAREMFYGEKD